MLLYDCYMTYSDRVIQFVRESYLEPASKAGTSVVRVRAGDVHKALHWNNRVPSVCQTLSSKRFLEENDLELVERHGPPSGLSTTTVYTYRLHKSGKTPRKKTGLMLSLRGAGKDAFAKLGGGEKFLKEERERWNETTAPTPGRKN